jgi:GNAT superfamily N-acetyltransferase
MRHSLFPRRVEEAALNAWPALQQMLFDGWLLRFAQGYSKRANSINPLYPSTLDLEEKVMACERCYAAKAQPPIFRLTPFASPALDPLLERRGYDQVAPTMVLHLDLDAPSPRPSFAGQLHTESLDDWMALFCRLQGTEPARHQTHLQILQSIPAPQLLASLRHAGQTVACGLGVLEQDIFGLFDLLTAPQKRNQGHGTRLVAGMLRWAQEHGARHAYLQVVRRNAPARRLYAKFGFASLYDDWYRIPHASKPGHSASSGEQFAKENPPL